MVVAVVAVVAVSPLALPVSRPLLPPTASAGGGASDSAAFAAPRGGGGEAPENIRKASSPPQRAQLTENFSKSNVRAANLARYPYAVSQL